jgi:hypothetical protein
MMEYSIFPYVIEDISYEDLSRGLMMDALKIALGDMRTKFLHLKVQENFYVPWVIG